MPLQMLHHVQLLAKELGPWIPLIFCKLCRRELVPCDAACVSIQRAAVAVPLSVVDTECVVYGFPCLIWLWQDMERAHHKGRLQKPLQDQKPRPSMGLSWHE